jgi:ribosomal protein S21
MPIHLQKREGENMNAFIYRFNKKVQHSGLMKEARKRRFRARAENRGKRRSATLYRLEKQATIARQRKLGSR